MLETMGVANCPHLDEVKSRDTCEGVHQHHPDNEIRCPALRSVAHAKNKIVALVIANDHNLRVGARMV